MIVSITRPKKSTAIVLRDARNEEYICTSDVELWQTVKELLEDPELQKVETVPAPSHEGRKDVKPPQDEGGGVDLGDLGLGLLMAAGSKLIAAAQDSSFRGSKAPGTSPKPEGGGG